MKRENKKRKNKEKIEKDAEDETKDKKERMGDNYDKQTKIAVAIMAVLIASILLANWIVQESKKFEYNGMKFYEEKEGSILFYKSLLGYITAGGQNIPFILKLRTDPKELDKIPINGSIDKLRTDVILSLSPEIADCPDTIRTMTDFSITLKAFGIAATAATTDKNYSKEHNAQLANCNNAKEKTVIVMKEGNQTEIIQNGDCYTININNCEIQESFERFILEYISNSIRL